MKLLHYKSLQIVAHNFYHTSREVCSYLLYEGYKKRPNATITFFSHQIFLNLPWTADNPWLFPCIQTRIWPQHQGFLAGSIQGWRGPDPLGSHVGLWGRLNPRLEPEPTRVCLRVVILLLSRKTWCCLKFYRKNKSKLEDAETSKQSIPKQSTCRF